MLALAFAAHAALIAALSAAWHTAPTIAPTIEATPVEIVRIDDLPAVVQMPRPSLTAAPQESVEAAEPDPGETPRIDAPPIVKPELKPLELPVPELLPMLPPVDTPMEKPKAAARPEPASKPTKPVTAKKANVDKSLPAKPEAPARSVEKPADEHNNKTEESSKRATPADKASSAIQKLERDAAAKPAAAPQAKRAAQRLDAQELANLLDKSVPKAQRRPLEVSDLADAIDQAQARASKLDAQATATLAQAIQAQIYPCWNPPMGSNISGRTKVVISAEFTRDGISSRAPKVVGVESFDPNYGRLVAESARRAVLRCAPLKLPGELYHAWREVELVFDPSELG